VEEPLEIRVRFLDGEEPVERSISVTMRTPGNDIELACGFLLTEGIVHAAEEIESVAHAGQPLSAEYHNIIRVTLREGTRVDFERLQRHFYTSSSCGVCGKGSIEAVRTVGDVQLAVGAPKVTGVALRGLVATAREAQRVFASTGGLHAAALFTPDGALQSVHEDVGRHNALDKLIGEAMRHGKLPLSDSIVLLSGRASFELVQKALIAGVPVLAAVGAPSSLAIELAQSFGMTLVGFLRDDRFNVYCGGERIVT
jgi:FdhD protein